ncbi:MAG: CHAT domain-containing protein [Aureispira sp.]|nr:CHAT domain-containing protein [Aureispira sp.]
MDHYYNNKKYETAISYALRAQQKAKKETGNGIASLARAFMYVGAPALIVSLWQVNDNATSHIMQQLYQNLVKGIDKDEALNQAKLQYKICSRHSRLSSFLVTFCTNG